MQGSRLLEPGIAGIGLSSAALSNTVTLYGLDPVCRELRKLQFMSIVLSRTTRV